MKKISKILAVAAVALLLFPGLVLALDLPPAQTFNFLNEDSSLAATIEVVISWEVADVSLRYDYTLTNYGFNPRGGADTTEAINKISVPVGTGIDSYGWSDGTSSAGTVNVLLSDLPWAPGAHVIGLEFLFAAKNDGTGLAPGDPTTSAGDSESFYLISTNMWDMDTFQVWDHNLNVEGQALASVSSPVGNNIEPVPEPTTLLLLGGSLLGLALLRRQKT